MRPIAAIIVVVFGVCSITTAARAEQSDCKQCREQQQACAKNYSAKTCKTEYDICMKSCFFIKQKTAYEIPPRRCPGRREKRSSCDGRDYCRCKACSSRRLPREG